MSCNKKNVACIIIVKIEVFLINLFVNGEH